MKIKNDKSSQEHLVEKFLEAAQSKSLRAACDFFYLHANDLSSGGPRQNLLLVDADCEDDVDDAADAVGARAATQGRKFLKDFLPVVMEPIKAAMVKLRQTLPEDGNPSKDSQAMIVNEIIKSDYSSQLEAFIPRALASNVGLAADFLGGSLLKHALEIRKRQMAATAGIVNYNAMVDALQRLELFTPKVRILLCGDCSNLEVTFGQHTGYTNECTKCASEGHVVSLLFPNAGLEQVKFANNSDLALFVSAYLRSKSFLPIQILPCAEYDVPGQAEADVALPELETAYEIKVLNSPATLNPNKILSEAQQIATQLKRYEALGFKRVVLIANIPQDEASKLLQMAKEKQPLSLQLDIVGAPFDEMLKKLDGMVMEIESHTETRLRKELDGRAGAPISKPGT